MRCSKPSELTGDPYEIHRMEERRAGADFSEDPAVHATPLSQPQVGFWYWTGAGWKGADDLFGSPQAEIDQDELTVLFWVRPPTEGDPAPAGKSYAISASVRTANGELLYGEWPLILLGGAS